MKEQKRGRIHVYSYFGTPFSRQDILENRASLWPSVRHSDEKASRLGRQNDHGELPGVAYMSKANHVGSTRKEPVKVIFVEFRVGRNARSLLARLIFQPMYQREQNLMGVCVVHRGR